MEGKDGRTERATSKRRQEERRKGNLVVSQEITTVLVLVLGFLCIRFAIFTQYEKIAILTQEIFRMPLGGHWNATLVQDWFFNGMLFFAALMMPLIVPLVIASLAANMAQTGPYFSMETLHWKWSSLNPINGAKQLISVQSFGTLLISIMKIGLIVLVIWLLLRRRLNEISGLAALSPAEVCTWTLSLIYRMIMAVAFLFIIIAAIDWLIKWYRHEKGMMMTKEEVKDERKQQEISPLVKRAQMRKMRELSMARMMSSVAKADVVITNPTHVAVALEYDTEKMGAPRVTAKGLRLVAERIKRIARENNVPILERPPLARDLYKHVKINQEIPARFYGLVAEILAYLYRMGQGRIRNRLAATPRAA